MRQARNTIMRRLSLAVGCWALAAGSMACGSQSDTPGYGVSPSTTGSLLPTSGGTLTGATATGTGGAPATSASAGAITTGATTVTSTVTASTASTTGAAGANNQERTPPSLPYQMCQVTMACQGAIPDDRDSDERVVCTFQVFDGAGAVQYDAYAGVKVRGRSSRNYPKQSYSVELWDQASLELSENLLGMGGESDWVLDGLWLDRSLLRNSLVYDLFRSIGAGRYGAKGRYCTLTLNGSPQGIYRLGERVKRDDDRLALIQDDGTGSSFVIKQHMNGVLRMPVQPGGGFSGGNPDEVNWEMVYPNQTTATPAQVAGVQAFLDGLSDARQNDPDSIFTTYLDVDTTADWILVNEFAKNIDAFHLSIHIFRDAGGLAGFVPWDFDLSMGQPTVQGEPENETPQGWVINHSQFLEQMLEASTLSVRIATRWAELRQGPLASAAVALWLDSYLATLDPNQVLNNFAIWPIEDVDFQQIYPSYTLYEVTSHSQEVARLRAWIDARLTWMDTNVASYPN